MKRIILLHTIDQFKRFDLFKNNLNPKIPIEFIAFRFKLRFFLKNKNIQYKIQEQYIDDNLGEEIDKVAYNIGDNWYENLFQFKGITLGVIIQGRLKLYLANVIKNIKTLLNLIEIEKPFEIIAFEDFNIYAKEFNRVLKKICLLKNTPLKIIPINHINVSSFKKKKSHSLLSINVIKGVVIQIFYKFINFLSKLLWFFKTSKIFKKNRNKKNIHIIYSVRSLLTLVKPFCNKHNVILLRYHIHNSWIKWNFKNLLFRKKVIFNQFVDDYYNKKTKLESNRFFKYVFPKWKKVYNSPDFKKIFIFNEIDLWSFVKKKVYEYIFYNFRAKIELIILVYKILRKNKPNLLILFSDTTEHTMPYALIASKLKIHSLIVQHGVIGTKYGYLPSFSEKFATWGQICKNILIENGLEAEKIIITGAHRLDRYIYINNNKKLKEEIKNSVYEEFNIEKNKKLIVLATGHGDLFSGYSYYSSETPNDVEKMYYCVLNTVKHIPDSYLLIKLHPYDPHSSLPKEIIKHLSIKNATVIKKGNIENIFTASDCVITTTSGTGLEAMMVEKPVIHLTFRNLTQLLFSYSYNAVHEVFNCKNLEIVIRNVLRKPESLRENQKKFLKDYIFKLDGLSTKRVIKLISDLIEN